MLYVLTMWESEAARHELILNGPFETQREASQWGVDWGDSHNDCPMWQLVDISSTDVPVRAPT